LLIVVVVERATDDFCSRRRDKLQMSQRPQQKISEIRPSRAFCRNQILHKNGPGRKPGPHTDSDHSLEVELRPELHYSAGASAINEALEAAAQIADEEGLSNVAARIRSVKWTSITALPQYHPLGGNHAQAQLHLVPTGKRASTLQTRLVTRAFLTNSARAITISCPW
jgi:hypothetical protein